MGGKGVAVCRADGIDRRACRRASPTFVKLPYFGRARFQAYGWRRSGSKGLPDGSEGSQVVLNSEIRKNRCRILFRECPIAFYRNKYNLQLP